MTVLSTLLALYALVLLFNSVLSAFIWYHHRENFHKLPFLLWSFSFVNYVLQGIFQEPNILMVCAYFTYYPCSLILVQFVNRYVRTNQPEETLPKRFIYSGYVCVAGVGLITMIQFDFFLAAFVASIAIAYPMIHTALSIFFSKDNKERESTFTKVFAILLLINGLHFMDYAFFRFVPEAPVYGFSLALFLIFSFSILIPTYSIRFHERKYSKSLEQEVAAQTLELKQAYQNLEKKNGMLDKRNKDLGEAIEKNRTLLSVICHDVANPLTIAKMNIDSVSRQIKKMPEKTEKLQNSVEKINRSTSIISAILNQVRDLNANAGSDMGIQLETVDLEKSVASVLQLFEDIMREKNISVKINKEQNENKLLVLAEPATLANQVLTNLISNAIKFSHKGSQIEISMGISNDQKVTLQITDHGIGMPDEVRNNLFNFDSNISRSGTSGEKGTGFGLPIVKQCLEQFGANIDVTSQCSENSDIVDITTGTSFELKFPKVS